MTQAIELSRISATLVKISQGGQGVVYKAPQISIPFAKSMVYKEYKQAALAALDVNALKAMPAFLESLPYGEGARLISIAAWPCRVVEDNGKATGFVMPTIPDEFFTDFWTVKGPSKVAAEFQHLLNEPHVLARSFGGQMISDRQRYALLRSLVSALTFLHGHSICVGDLSPKNLLFSLSGSPETYFIDCDAMRVNGVSLTTQLETPGWEVPTGEEKATTSSDRYKLGLLALRLIVGSQDARDPGRLPAAVHPSLRQVITNTLTQPAANRPSLSTWDSALEQAWQAAPTNPPPPPPPPVPPVAPVQVIPPPSPSRPMMPAQGMPPPAPPIPVVQPRNAAAVPVPQNYAPPPAPGSQPSKPSGKRAWLVVPVVFGALVLAAKFDPAWFSDGAKEQSADNRTTARTPTRTTTPMWTPTSTVPSRTTTTSPTPVNVVPPAEAPGLDPAGESCSGGYYLTSRSGWATKAIRGTERTSCKFTDSILRAYWDNFTEPSRDRRSMEVASPVVRCDSVPGASCAPGGQLFVVTCQAYAGEDWITCEGGNRAEVYLY